MELLVSHIHSKDDFKRFYRVYTRSFNVLFLFLYVLLTSFLRYINVLSNISITLCHFISIVFKCFMFATSVRTENITYIMYTFLFLRNKYCKAASMFLKNFPIWGSNVSYIFLRFIAILYVQYLISTKKPFLFNYVYTIDMFSFKENYFFLSKLLLFRKSLIFPCIQLMHISYMFLRFKAFSASCFLNSYFL